MTRDYQPIDPARIKTYSVKERRHKSHIDSDTSLPQAGASAARLIASFPDYLGASSLANSYLEIFKGFRFALKEVKNTIKTGYFEYLFDGFV